MQQQRFDAEKSQIDKEMETLLQLAETELDQSKEKKDLPTVIEISEEERNKIIEQK